LPEAPSPPRRADPESRRLAEDAARDRNWKRWGPYLADRQWATVREDYSADGDAWSYFPHEHARSRAYRWGEDGLLGVCDREGRLCLAVALWNGVDAILKERLFGLTSHEGNHGEDVKEVYFHLASTPTHSYMKALYRYSQAPFPYALLVAENRRRTPRDPEFELLDTGVFDGNRFFDVTAEYAKASPDDLLLRLTVANRGDAEATLHLLPTLWFRNTWGWEREGQTGYWPRPELRRGEGSSLVAEHVSLGRFVLAAEPLGDGPEWLFTDNETNAARLYGAPNPSPYVKDAFHEAVVDGRRDALRPDDKGTKAAAWYRLKVPAGGALAVRLRLSAASETSGEPFGPGFDGVLAARADEARIFYAAHTEPSLSPTERTVVESGYAGLLWSKQFYFYVVRDWLAGDPGLPPPPPGRGAIRNGQWPQLYNADVLLMPDSWEYPWYAAWDLAFHVVALARIDPALAKQQLLLMLREWYMHPSGQLPAYEYNFSDVNPPVHAWACWRVYKLTGARGRRDRIFLERAFHKLLLNFTWWVNRKDSEGNNLFGGGFLGLDNIGVFDRSKPLPGGGVLEQADGTAWMAFFCVTMLAIALELAAFDAAYEDVASKFFEHFVAIADAINAFGGSGLWDDEDGFYYDRLHVDGTRVPLRIRSLVGLIPLLAVEVLDDDVIARLPGFSRRMHWFLDNRSDLARHIAYMEQGPSGNHRHRLLAVPSRDRLERLLARMLDEDELLSPFGIRSLSKAHAKSPFVLRLDGEEHRVDYEPGESTTWLFGGNSNWRGPVWLPLNYLLIEALERYDHFYGDSLRVACPAGSGRACTLREAAHEVATRVARLFLPDAQGGRPLHGDDPRWTTDPLWRDHVLFYEYFHAETGRGCGASHQTGWTALALRLIEDLAAGRAIAGGRTVDRSG
jgi:Mannosylglycerate hydrolase MGH1-like glycoside hydrolase domain/Glycosyl hydrolase family 63 C-terminal domain